MLVHVHTICRNESQIMPYFLRHYSTVADKIFVTDDKSDDGTREIVQSFPKAVLLDYEPTTGLDDIDIEKTNQQLVITHSRGVADWVMVPNADEFIYHKRGVTTMLERCRAVGYRAIQCCGYNMISESLPTNGGQIYDELKEGVRCKWYNKALVFDPNVNVEFGRGRHSMKFETGVVPAYAGFMMLHYRFIGLRYIIDKNLKNLDHINKSSFESKGFIRRNVRWTYERALPIYLEKSLRAYIDGLKNKTVVV